MSIKDSNKLIADFLGWKKHEGYTYITPFFQNYLTVEHGFEQTPIFMEDYLLFHKDWNWLMLVVEKIENLDNFKYRVSITANVVYIEISETREEITLEYEDSKFNCIYYSIIEFIKWYNNNNKN